jgi:hypothetical protein
MVKLLQEKTGNTLDRIGNNCINITSIAQQLRGRTDKWNCIEQKASVQQMKQ